MLIDSTTRGTICGDAKPSISIVDSPDGVRVFLSVKNGSETITVSLSLADVQQFDKVAERAGFV